MLSHNSHKAVRTGVEHESMYYYNRRVICVIGGRATVLVGKNVPSVVHRGCKHGLSATA